MKKAKKTTAKRRAEPDQLQQEFLDRIPAEQKDEKVINIIFDGPPSHESGRFVEVENDSGTSIGIGEWIDRADGYWALRITDTDFNALPPHRTDEKGGTRPPDEHHELQDFADKRTAPGEQKAEKVYIDDLLSLPPDEQKDELRCIDCGEKARAVNTRNGFCYVCEHNNHTTTAFYPTKASAKAAYRKLIDDRAIADRARAEDRRLNEDCTDYTPWPIREIVKALAGATTHLFDTHDCDIHGYELWKCALEAANKYLAPLNPDYAQMVTDDAEAREDKE